MCQGRHNQAARSAPAPRRRIAPTKIDLPRFRRPTPEPASNKHATNPSADGGPMPKPGSTTARGYGITHQRERQRLLTLQAAGTTLTCWRCGGPITPGQPWDLGHDDHDRTITRGPEHRHPTGRCPGNRAAPRRRRTRTPTPITTRPW